jgi:PAS domain-containing protein
VTESELTFSIGEVAAMLGISPHTIRAWERRHLMVKPARTRSGQRRYTGDDVELLKQVKHERHVHGLSMRVATMTAQGLIVPQDGGGGWAAAQVADRAEMGADPQRTMLNLISEVVVVLDADGRVAYANTAFVRFCDVLRGKLRGRQFADFVDPFDRAKAVQTYQAPLRQRRGWELNLRAARRRALFSFDCWPVEFPEGLQIVLVGRDLTQGLAGPVAGDEPEAAAPEVELLEARTPPTRIPERFRRLLNGAAHPARVLALLGDWLERSEVGIALVTVDHEPTVLSANPALERSVGPAAGTALRDLWPETADPERLTEAIEEALGTGRPAMLAGWPSAGSGDRLSDLELYPVTDWDGRVTHLVAAVADVTGEVEVSRRFDPLLACEVHFQAGVGPAELLRRVARHAQDLVPNAGLLVALAADRRRSGIAVVAASGVWARADRGVGQDFGLTLVHEVVRAGAAMELCWEGGQDGTETFHIVPLLPEPASPPGTEALGAIAFARLGATPFAARDRDLVAELAGRLGIALERTQLLASGAETAAPGALRPGPTRI